VRAVQRGERDEQKMFMKSSKNNAELFIGGVVEFKSGRGHPTKNITPTGKENKK